jgi:hypothetical protein
MIDIIDAAGKTPEATGSIPRPEDNQ